MSKKHLMLFCLLFLNPFFTHATDVDQSGKGRTMWVGIGGGSYSGAVLMPEIKVGLGFPLVSANNWTLEICPQLIGGMVVAVGGGVFLLEPGLVVKLGYSFDFSKNRSLELYGKVPLGYSFILGSSVKGWDAMHGLHLGISPGLAYFFNRSLGIFWEIGFIKQFAFAGSRTDHALIVSGTLGMQFRF